MRILISGYYGFHNIGDEAILKSIITSLREVSPSIKITVLSNDVEHTKSTYNVEAINRWNLAKIYAELLKSDGLISGGGSLLQDATSSRPIIYYTSIIGLAKLARKPVFIYAQGLGPIDKESSKKITKRFLNKADYITLRDQESIDLAKYIGINKNIDIVPDPVMGFDISDFESELCDKYKDRNYITVSVRDWSKASVDYLKNIAIACDNIASSGTEIVFIPMHGEHDKKTSETVINMMKQKAEIFPYNASIEDKILCIKYSRLMIGMRLHALIFASTVGTPMIGITYDPKIDSFLALVDQPCVGKVYEEWNAIDLSSKAIDIIKKPEKIKFELENKSRKFKELAILTAKKAIDLFDSK